MLFAFGAIDAHDRIFIKKRVKKNEEKFSTYTALIEALSAIVLNFIKIYQKSTHLWKKYTLQFLMLIMKKKKNNNFAVLLLNKISQNGKSKIVTRIFDPHCFKNSFLNSTHSPPITA